MNQPSPLDVLHDISATHGGIAVTFHDFFFIFQVLHNFWHQISPGRAFCLEATPILKKSVETEIAQNRDFVYKVYVNWVFSKYSQVQWYFLLLWASIYYFTKSMLQKVQQ